MYRLVLGLALSFALAGATAMAAAPEEAATAEQPDRVENFRLIDHQDRSIELYRYREAKAVVLYLYGIGCPIVRQSVPAFNRLREEFEPEGVRFLLINAHAHDTREEIAEDAEAFEIDTPILLDVTQRITRSLGADRLAEAIVVDPQDDWKIIFRGAIDDRFDYGAARAEAQHEWLRDALAAHVKGEEVPLAQAPVRGCLIGFPEEQPISYARDIAPILEAKCVTCHTAGGLGPFALSNHRRVQGWAPMIREVIRTKQMPPWHADPHFGTFRNDLSLSADEERTLLAWIEAGAPKDEEEADPLRDVERDGEPRWALGEPDLVLEMPEEVSLPAEGVFEYRYFYLPTNLTEDKWVRALEVQPGTPAVLHHALVFVVYPKEYRHIQPEVRGGLNGYFAAFLPGTEIEPYPEATGQFLPAGSTIVFQMHYNATGRPETDQSRIGLYFHEEKPDMALMVRGAAETEFAIPPHATDHPISANWRFREDAVLYGLSPHMHYRGSRARFTAEFPDGETQTLLNIPWYEFDWQPMYLFDTPVPMPAETRLRTEGAFDNSAQNPRNPNPDATVRFGEQSWEEMFIGYVKYAVARDDEFYAPREVEEGEGLDAETLAGTQWRIGRGMLLLLNEDGSVNIRGQNVGQWKVVGNVVEVEGLGRRMQMLIQGSELLFNGRPVRQVLPGEEEEDARPQQERRGPQQPEDTPEPVASTR